MVQIHILYVFIIVYWNISWFSYKNPYKYELDEIKIPEEHLKVVKATKPALFEDTKFVEVYNMEQFNLMISDLQRASELAVDLEVK